MEANKEIELLDKQIGRLDSWIRSLKKRREAIMIKEWQRDHVRIGECILVRNQPRKVIGFGFRGRLIHPIVEGNRAFYGTVKIVEFQSG